MTTFIAYAIMAAVIVSYISVSYAIGKAAGAFISWIMETFRKAFH